MYCAQLDINNICNAVSELSGTVCPAGTVELNSYDTTVLGMQYINGIFQPVPPTTPVGTWLISVGAFFDRFDPAKQQILASTDANIQAMVKDAQVRKFIDLQRPDLPLMLDYIIAAGYGINKALILNTPAAPSELP